MERHDDTAVPGSQPAHFLRGRQDEVASGTGNEGHRMSNGGDRDNPGEQPDEIVPTEPDTDRPDTPPAAVAPGPGAPHQPDRAPTRRSPPPAWAPRAHLPHP